MGRHANKQVPTISPASQQQRWTREETKGVRYRASVRSCELTSSRLYNTFINTYTIGWYNRIIRVLLVFYVHNTYKVTLLNRSHIIMYKRRKSKGYIWKSTPPKKMQMENHNSSLVLRICIDLFTYLPINLDHDILILRIPTYFSNYPWIWFTIFWS